MGQSLFKKYSKSQKFDEFYTVEWPDLGTLNYVSKQYQNAKTTLKKEKYGTE